MGRGPEAEIFFTFPVNGVMLRIMSRTSEIAYLIMLKSLIFGHFDKDFKRYVNIPAHSRMNRKVLLEKNRRALELSEKSKFNFIDGDGKSDVGIITSGVSYTYVKEYTKNVDILKIGFTNPVPEKKIADFVKSKKKIIVVEELDPYLEDNVLRICGQNKISTPIIGKRDGTLPKEWEFSPDTIRLISKLVDTADMPEPLPFKLLMTQLKF